MLCYKCILIPPSNCGPLCTMTSDNLEKHVFMGTGRSDNQCDTSTIAPKHQFHTPCYCQSSCGIRNRDKILNTPTQALKCRSSITLRIFTAILIVLSFDGFVVRLIRRDEPHDVRWSQRVHETRRYHQKAADAIARAELLVEQQCREEARPQRLGGQYDASLRARYAPERRYFDVKIQ